MTAVTADIWIDLSCPWCYLAINAFRTTLATAQFGARTQAVVRPFFLDAESDLENDVAPSLVDHLKKRKGLSEVEVRSDLEKLKERGRERGINFNFDGVTLVTTTYAQRLIVLAQQIGEETGDLSGSDTLQLRVTEALQRAYFELGLNLSDQEVLIGVGQDFGIPAEKTITAVWGDESLASAVSDGYSLALHLGVESVPLFLFDEQFVVEGNQSVESFAEVLKTVWLQHGTEIESENQ